MILHSEVVQFVNSSIDRVWFTKCGLEGFLEGVPVECVLREFVVVKRKIPPLGSTFQVRDCVGYLYFIVIEVIWTCSEYQFAL